MSWNANLLPLKWPNSGILLVQRPDESQSPADLSFLSAALVCTGKKIYVHRKKYVINMSHHSWMPTPTPPPGWEGPHCWRSIASLYMCFASEIHIPSVWSSRPMTWRNLVLIQALEESNLQSSCRAFLCISLPVWSLIPQLSQTCLYLLLTSCPYHRTQSSSSCAQSRFFHSDNPIFFSFCLPKCFSNSEQAAVQVPSLPLLLKQSNLAPWLNIHHAWCPAPQHTPGCRTARLLMWAEP